MSAPEAARPAPRRSGRPTGCRRSRPPSCGKASSRGRTRSAARTTTRAERRRRARSTASARSRRRSPPTAIMQLRDVGALDLDDRLGQHLAGLADGSPTIRRMLAHISGLQREVGEMFVDGTTPTEDDLEVASRSALRRRTTTRTSPSALLGRVVAAKSGWPYMDYVDERIIGPLGLARTTWRSQEPKAQGYLVDEYARTVWIEPETDLGGVAAMGQLWSTVEDLATWATFLARGSRRGARRRRRSRRCGSRRSCTCPTDWVLGWGLGLMLYNQNGKIFGGHGGAMAGHLAGVYVHRKTQIGAAALTNSGTRGEHGAVRHLARREGDGALAGADRAVAARSRSTRRCALAARPLVVGGERVRLLVGGTARCRRRSWARRPGVPRRRSSATATAGAPPSGASVASACGSRTGSSSGRATRSPAHSSRSRL